MSWWVIALVVVLAVVVLVAVYDVTQRRHAVLRNFPIIGHLRYLLERIGPELRQYIVTGNDQERPFNRNERRWVYASSKQQNNYFGFGSDSHMDARSGYIILRPALFPYPAANMPIGGVPCAKVLGGHRQRRHAFRPPSIVNISGMSFGSLSGPAVEALNRGAAQAGCLHNTGEGGISRHHRHGGELMLQIGTAYFGCRDERGRFSLERLVELCQRDPVRAIEIKLSQGAKPGQGGVLPGPKVTAEIAAARGVTQGIDCVSPSGHSAFRDLDSMLDFVEMVADATGLPVGIKAAVGSRAMWVQLAQLMESGTRGVDFITVDGGEGGTGAAPLVFADHVSLPFMSAHARVYSAFAERDLQDAIVFVGSGRLGLPHRAALGFALGVDLVHVAREAMLSIGCIQAQRCHTGHCPAGVATQSAWLARGLDPPSKADRAARYVTVLRSELLKLAHTCGVAHPGLLNLDHIELLDHGVPRNPWTQFAYQKGWSLPSDEDVREITRLMDGVDSAHV